MEYRTFKNSGDKLSLLGFGGMRLPTSTGGPVSLNEQAADIDEAAATLLVDAAISGGVNYFDTAYNYHGGASELFFGRALSRYERSKYHLTSKMPLWLVNSIEDAQRIFDEQLARCQTEYFDYYLCHSMIQLSFDNMKKLGLFDFLYKKKSQGLIRNLGFSFHDKPPVLKAIASEWPWDFGQLQLNYLDWEYLNGKEMYQTLEALGIPCFVMEPVRGGRLADIGKAGNDILNTANPSASTASWAIRWAASLPNVACVLSGMSTQQQLKDNIATLSPLVPLSQSEHDTLNKALESFKQFATIPCTACRYCLPCPHGVDIPGLFELYNQIVFDSDSMYLKARYRRLPQEQNAGACVACGHCERLCPQHIAISKQLQSMHKAATS